MQVGSYVHYTEYARVLRVCAVMTSNCWYMRLHHCQVVETCHWRFYMCELETYVFCMYTQFDVALQMCHCSFITIQTFELTYVCVHVYASKCLKHSLLCMHVHGHLRTALVYLVFQELSSSWCRHHLSSNGQRHRWQCLVYVLEHNMIHVYVYLQLDPLLHYVLLTGGPEAEHTHPSRLSK